MGYEVTFYLVGGTELGHYIEGDKFTSVNIARAEIGGKVWDAKRESMFVKIADDMELNPDLITHFIVKEYDGQGA